MKGPYPPCLNQHYATLPDGSPDPDALTDCGETCCASEVAAWVGRRVRVGAVRAAFGLRGPDGSSGAAQFVPYLDGLGLAVSPVYAAARRAAGLTKRHTTSRRRHVLGLGYWQGWEELHWVVWYGGHLRGVWGMDPWLGAYVFWPWREWRQAYAGSLVVVGRQ